MSADTKHTAMPKFGKPERNVNRGWMESKGLDEDGDNGDTIAIVCRTGDEEEELALIGTVIRACNAHDDLVKALQQIATGATGFLDRDSALAEIAQAALDEAGAA